MLIVICIPIFFACNNNSTLWLTTNTIITNFLNNSDFGDYSNGDITFSSSLELKRDEANSQFYDLTYYENILGSCFTNAKKHYGSFAITPIYNLSQATSLCTQVNNALVDFVGEIETFNLAKQTFLSATDNLTYNNVVAISKLNIFKTSFYNLILKANAFNKSFTSAYEKLYGTEISSETATASGVYNKVAEVYSNLIGTYITYAFTEFNGNCTDGNDFYNKLLELKTELASSECSTTNFASWLTYYESFESEKSMFLTALANIDLTADNESPSELQQQYLNKIERFVNTNAGLFITETIELFI